jgi:hypothetical protein
LTKYHVEHLIPTGEALHILVATILGSNTIELSTREKICKLREDIFALIHHLSFWAKLKNESQFKSSRNHNLLKTRYTKHFKEQFFIFSAH